MESDIVVEERVLSQVIARVEAELKEQPAQALRMQEVRVGQAGGSASIARVSAQALHVDASAPLFAGHEELRPFMPYARRSTRESAKLNQREPPPRLEEINRILQKLQNDSAGVEASALISEDGLMIASCLTAEMEETRVAGMAATLQNLGGRASAELARGTVREVIVRGEGGYVVMINASRGALLLALVDEGGKLGLIFFDMREAVKALEEAL